MKTTILDLVVTPREVDIPDTCPQCKVWFGEQPKDRPPWEQEYLRIVRIETTPTLYTLRPDGLEHIDAQDGGDVLGYVSIACAKCGHVLAQGKQERHTEWPFEGEESLQGKEVIE